MSIKHKHTTLVYGPITPSKPHNQGPKMERHSRRLLEIQHDPRKRIILPSAEPKDSDNGPSPPSSNLPTSPTTPAPKRKTAKLHHHHYTTRLCIRTPINKTDSAPPQRAHNTMRQMKREKEIELGIKPCPGEMGVPNGLEGAHSRRFRVRVEKELVSEEMWKREVEGMIEGEKWLRMVLKRRL